uniref:Secreted protein n=1 Tax=Macrostomum lignano TaxID=282301 RepID=A0A1I8FE19_9PLAT
MRRSQPPLWRPFPPWTTGVFELLNTRCQTAATAAAPTGSLRMGSTSFRPCCDSSAASGRSTRCWPFLSNWPPRHHGQPTGHRDSQLPDTGRWVRCVNCSDRLGRSSDTPCCTC